MHRALLWRRDRFSRDLGGGVQQSPPPQHLHHCSTGNPAGNPEIPMARQSVIYHRFSQLIPAEEPFSLCEQPALGSDDSCSWHLLMQMHPPCALMGIAGTSGREKEALCKHCKPGREISAHSSCGEHRSRRTQPRSAGHGAQSSRATALLSSPLTLPRPLRGAICSADLTPPCG